MKRAIVAVGHTILANVCHILKNHVKYSDTIKFPSDVYVHSYPHPLYSSTEVTHV